MMNTVDINDLREARVSGAGEESEWRKNVGRKTGHQRGGPSLMEHWGKVECNQI